MRMNGNASIGIYAIVVLLAIAISVPLYMLYMDEDNYANILPPNKEESDCIGYFTAVLNVQAMADQSENGFKIRALPEITFTSGLAEPVSVLKINDSEYDYWSAVLTISPRNGEYDLIQTSIISVPESTTYYSDVSFIMPVPMYVDEEGTYTYALEIFNHMDDVSVRIYYKGGSLSAGEIPGVD